MWRHSCGTLNWDVATVCCKCEPEAYAAQERARYSARHPEPPPPEPQLPEEPTPSRAERIESYSEWQQRAADVDPEKRAALHREIVKKARRDPNEGPTYRHIVSGGGIETNRRRH